MKIGRIDTQMYNHGAYNRATKEVIFFSTANALRYGVKRRSEMNHADGIKNDWVFSHNGVDGLTEKIRCHQGSGK